MNRNLISEQKLSDMSISSERTQQNIFFFLSQERLILMFNILCSVLHFRCAVHEWRVKYNSVTLCLNLRTWNDPNIIMKRESYLLQDGNLQSILLSILCFIIFPKCLYIYGINMTKLR